MKICPVGAELFNEDGHTEQTKLIVAFRNVANAPTIASHEQYSISHSPVAVGPIIIHDKPFVRDYKKFVFVIVLYCIVVW